MSFARSTLCRSVLTPLSRSIVRKPISNQFFGGSFAVGHFNTTSPLLMNSTRSMSAIRPIANDQSITNIFSSLLIGRTQPVVFASTMRKRKSKMNKVNIYKYIFFSYLYHNNSRTSCLICFKDIFPIITQI